MSGRRVSDLSWHGGMGNELWQLSATEVVQKLKDGEVTPLQLIDVAEARIKEIDPVINAAPILCFERARKAAANLKIPANPGPGYLYGLPILVKDTAAVKGILWTMGSRIYKDRIAEEDDPQVELLERNGAIIIGKTNIPEFAAGSNTYNDVFGETLNPWDTNKTCGGSSGGAAAALAAGEVWLATGGDLGGSLRIPASFCGVIGFRASVGRVPHHFSKAVDVKSISGAMARSVPDLALMLDAMVGQHPRDPESLPAPDFSFQDIIKEGAWPSPMRLAWSGDLGGISPTDPEVAQICQRATYWFESLGASVSQACPDLTDADFIFQVLRADEFKLFQQLMKDPVSKSLLKPELHWQINKGIQQSPEVVQEAREGLAALRARVDKFFQKFDLLCTPCVMVPAFDVSTRWLKQLGGTTFTNYVEWLLMTFAFSLVDVPAISVPCGLTAAGLPVGLQIIGGHREDAAVLHAAALYERSQKWKDMVPLQRLGQ